MVNSKKIKDQNERWTGRKVDAVPQKYKHPNHPWADTNRFIKTHHDKIWTDLITPENQRIQECSAKKKS